MNSAGIFNLVVTVNKTALKAGVPISDPASSRREHRFEWWHAFKVYFTGSIKVLKIDDSQKVSKTLPCASKSVLVDLHTP